jgi:hypothetical protein
LNATNRLLALLACSGIAFYSIILAGEVEKTGWDVNIALIISFSFY